MKNSEKLCPFKRTLDYEYTSETRRRTVHERFEFCAGERCMAYSKGPFDKEGKCLRLEAACPAERGQ